MGSITFFVPERVCFRLKERPLHEIKDFESVL
jgi:hypothetical protein